MASKYQPKTVVLKNGSETILLDGRVTIERLVKAKKLYELEGVSEITGLCVRYLRRLCHGEPNGRRIAHHRLLGRYYMTPAQVAELLEPVPAKKARA